MILFCLVTINMMIFFLKHIENDYSTFNEYLRVPPIITRRHCMSISLYFKDRTRFCNKSNSFILECRVHFYAFYELELAGYIFISSFYNAFSAFVDKDFNKILT